MWKWLKNRLMGYQTTFDSPYPIEKCRQILQDYAEQAPFDYYSNEEKVMDIQQESDDSTSFFIHKNLWDFMDKKKLSLLKLTGTLKQIDTGTRITQYVHYTKSAWRDISLTVMVSTTLIISILWAFLSKPPVHFGVVISCIIILAIEMALLRYPLSRLGQTPYRLLSDKAQRPPRPLIFQKPERVRTYKERTYSQSRLIKTEFSFHSPYPIDECVNQLLNHSATQDYHTPWGIGKGAKVNNMVVIVYEHPDNTYGFVVRTDGRVNRLVYGKAQSVGALYAQEHGTRVKGDIYNRMEGRLRMGFILTLGLIALFVITTNIIMLPIAIISLGMFYMNMIHRQLQVGTYPQRILGEKSALKPKLEEDTESPLKHKLAEDTESPFKPKLAEDTESPFKPKLAENA
jgi:hypothetical protein